MAYAEYLNSPFDDAARMVESADNVVMTRTFLAYGLAGLRLGWAYCSPDLLTTLASIRGPFSVNRVAFRAGIAAVRDIEFQNKSVAHNDKWIAAMVPFLMQLGLEVIPSSANFILFRFNRLTGRQPNRH